MKDDVKITTTQEQLKKLLREHSKKKDVKITLKVLDKAIHSEGDKIVKLIQEWENFGP